MGTEVPGDGGGGRRPNLVLHCHRQTASCVRWSVMMRAVLMEQCFTDGEGQRHKTASTDHKFTEHQETHILNDDENMKIN